ncbi:MAG: class I tRNA ligase family protein, partial [Burkholderiaceae bacterium]|nr:class I tRNA ligase family protein [Burkholderiaceae bacterium]
MRPTATRRASAGASIAIGAIRCIGTTFRPTDAGEAFRGRRNGATGRAAARRGRRRPRKRRRRHPDAHRGGRGAALRSRRAARHAHVGRLVAAGAARAGERARAPAQPLRRAARGAIAREPARRDRPCHRIPGRRARHHAAAADPRPGRARRHRGAHARARRNGARARRPDPQRLIHHFENLTAATPSAGTPPAAPNGADALARSFEPADIEARWYPIWESCGYFAAGNAPGAEAFSIQLPPPNVTGTLHMGHAFQQTLMDALTRYHRMRGANTLWLPGTDHAGIATQIVVERQLDAQGVSRHDLGREQFIERVWRWKQQSGSTITRQMRRLGASTDWSLEYFTMDPRLSEVVKEVFVRLYEQGLIYRGKRLVNWDPELLTAVSDLEVVSEEEEGQLWQIRYPLADGSGCIAVATTRPETMLGDTAVMVHPDDERYAALVGKSVLLPLSGKAADPAFEGAGLTLAQLAGRGAALGWREIPIIADAYVEREFGTGAVKITPAHDFNDYAVGQRHGLPTLGVLTLDARINENASPKYRGHGRFDARRMVVADLEALGLLDSVKAHRMMVPRGDRTNAVIEPMLTDQWFVAMSKPTPSASLLAGKSIAQRSLEVVADGSIRFVPESWTATYDHWLANIQDWCISRQLWWGHQIP